MNKPLNNKKKSMLQCSEQKHLNIKTMKTLKEQQEMTVNAKRLAKWFKIEVTISIFGKVIIHWVYPPQND